jgi:hypothetical protein
MSVRIASVCQPKAIQLCFLGQYHSCGKQYPVGDHGIVMGCTHRLSVCLELSFRKIYTFLSYSVWTKEADHK